MKRDYRKKFKKLERLPTEEIKSIYIIPDKAYNGFWGKNGYKSYDFILAGITKNEPITFGWIHWERRCYKYS